MNRYENEICVGCGKPMHEGENIVVCPDCGTPQHLECYNKLGSCVNGYLHASGYEWQAEKKEEKPETEREKPRTSVCPACGAENPPNSIHCRQCGNMLQNAGGANQPPLFGSYVGPIQGPGTEFSSLLNGTGMSADDPLGDETAENVALYLKRGQAKFMPRFKKFSGDEGKKISWNWAALFLAPYYFFYRRMFKVGVAFASIFVVISLVTAPSYNSAFEDLYKFMEANSSATFETEEQANEFVQDFSAEMKKATQKLLHDPVIVICAAVKLLCHIAAAITADGLYFKKILRDIKAVRERYPDERVYKGLLLRVGGTSPLGFISSYFCLEAAVSVLASLADFISR